MYYKSLVPLGCVLPYLPIRYKYNAGNWRFATSTALMKAILGKGFQFITDGNILSPKDRIPLIWDRKRELTCFVVAQLSDFVIHQGLAKLYDTLGMTLSYWNASFIQSGTLSLNGNWQGGLFYHLNWSSPVNKTPIKHHTSYISINWNSTSTIPWTY